MKRLLFFLFLIFMICQNAIAQAKISGQVFKNINKRDKKPAEGTAVYAYAIQDSSDSRYIHLFLDAISQYAEYKNSVFHSGKSGRGYRLAREYRDSADIEFSRMKSKSKKEIINVKGEYSFNLAKGTYLLFFVDPDYPYEKVFFINYQGSDALITKKIRSPLLSTKFYIVNIEDSDSVINYTYN